MKSLNSTSGMIAIQASSWPKYYLSRFIFSENFQISDNNVYLVPLYKLVSKGITISNSNEIILLFAE
jgi:hypothetical protein